MASSSINLLTFTIFTLLFILPSTLSQDLGGMVGDLIKDTIGTDNDLGKALDNITRTLLAPITFIGNGGPIGALGGLTGGLGGLTGALGGATGGLGGLTGGGGGGGGIGILRLAISNSRQFKSFGSRLNQTQVLNQLIGQFNNMTIFAPTDKAFQNLPAGLSNAELVLHHVLPKYYSLDDLANLINPVKTLAHGTDLFLNFTRVANQMIVSNGVVNTPIIYTLREEFPLAVYAVDQLLGPSIGV